MKRILATLFALVLAVVTGIGLSAYALAEGSEGVTDAVPIEEPAGDPEPAGEPEPTPEPAADPAAELASEEEPATEPEPEPELAAAATFAAPVLRLASTPLRSGGDPTSIDSVSITVTPPAAGTRSVNAAPDMAISTEGVSIASASWKTFKGYATDDPAQLTFTEGQSYYAVLTLKAADGYEFKLGSYYSSGDIDGCDYN